MGGLVCRLQFCGFSITVLWKWRLSQESLKLRASLCSPLCLWHQLPKHLKQEFCTELPENEEFRDADGPSDDTLSNLGVPGHNNNDAELCMYVQKTQNIADLPYRSLDLHNFTHIKSTSMALNYQTPVQNTI